MSNPLPRTSAECFASLRASTEHKVQIATKRERMLGAMLERGAILALIEDELPLTREERDVARKILAAIRGRAR